MKIYDFDAKFFEYARTWMALHPGVRRIRSKIIITK